MTDKDKKHDWIGQTCKKCNLFRFMTADSCERVTDNSYPLNPLTERYIKWVYILDDGEQNFLEVLPDCSGVPPVRTDKRKFDLIDSNGKVIGQI